MTGRPPAVSTLAHALNEAAIVAVTDRRGRITHCNEKFCQISGYEASELVGQTHRIINSGHHPKSFFAEMYGTISRGEVWSGTICNRTKTGDLYWVDTTIVPEMGADGTPKSYTAVRFEVTDHISALEALKLSRAEAERAAEVRDRFFANMSHEVRTPLNGVLGLASALALTSLDEKQAGMVDLITRSGDTLRRVLDDVLDASRMKAGELKLASAPFEARTEIAAGARIMRELADQKHLALDVEFDDRVPEWLMGDAVRIRQIISNLTSNAIKFTAEGSVRVRVATRGPDNRLRLRIMISDTGIGFDRTTGRRLFQPFSQADDSISRRFGGTGLGLSICRMLTNMMGGSVRARSAPGRGAIFCVSIPVARAVAPQAFVGEAAPLPASSLTVLLVEDNPTNQAVVRCLLEPFEIALTIAEDGREALRMLHNGGGFDAVLMDMQMPVMDGLAAVAEIRARERATGRKPMPIAMLTANTSELHRQQAAAAGADLVIAKPINADTLVAGLEALLAGAEDQTHRAA